MNRDLFLLLGLIITLVGGCTMAPKYTRPVPPIPADWSGEAKTSQGSSVAPETAELKWQEYFPDNRLQKLIETALSNNRDLRLATLNVERTRAIYSIQRAELLPPVRAVGSGSKERVPGDLSTSGNAITSERYAVNLGISSWEIDFFGRIRSLKDQALEEYLSTEEARGGAQLLLVSSIAQAYQTLAADREALKLSQSTLETQQAAFNLIKKRYEAGIATELDMMQVQTQVDTARRDIARYTQQVDMDENILNLLLSSPAPENLLPADLSSVVLPREVSPHLSSEVLLLRPDILQAEHRLKGAYANIGAARAAFFPRIALTTTIGTASSELSGLFKSGQDTWSFAPQITLPVFDARTWPALKVSKVDREIAVTLYEKAIQGAFREVADTLAVRNTVDQQVSAQESLVNTMSQSYRLSDARYTKGIDSYLNVLDAQRSLYSAQQGLIILRLARANNLVMLYRVLGGRV